MLFGSLQKITAQQVGVAPISDGRGQQLRRRDGQDDRRPEHRRGQHRDPWYGHEGNILRYVFFHSIALAALVGMIVFLMAYVAPFTHLVLH